MDTTATLNPILTSAAAQFMRDRSGFVAGKLFPGFSAALQSASYYLFTASELATIASLGARAPGTKYPRVKRSVSSDSYAAADYGIEAPVPDEDRKKYGAYFDADMSAIRQIVDTILINREIRVYNKVISASVPTAAVSVPWNDGASSPKVDVDAARENIRKNIGLMANTLVLTQPILNTLSIHPKLQDVFKYTVGGILQEQKLAQYFGVDEVVVARNVIATNNEGQTFTPADIWGNLVCLAHVEPGQDLLLPNFGRTFFWNAFTSEITPQTGGTGPGMAVGGGAEPLAITSYRDETVKSDIHRSEHYVDEKITAPNAGFTLSGIIA